MGSILTFYNPSEWYIKQKNKAGDKVIVCIGDIDDYYNEELKVSMSKDLYLKITTGKYSVKKTGRSLTVYDKEDKVIIVL